MMHVLQKPRGLLSAVNVQFLICEVADSTLSRVTHMDMLVLAAVMNQRMMQKPVSEAQRLYPLLS